MTPKAARTAARIIAVRRTWPGTWFHQSKRPDIYVEQYDAEIVRSWIYRQDPQVHAQEDERPPMWGRSGGCEAIYWCGHCQLWVDAECGAADEIERVLGPICDDCAAEVFAAMEQEKVA